MSKFKRFALSTTVATFLAVLACALYLPYLGNKPVFDDHNIFTSLSVYDFAQTFFDLLPRTFPNFTLGIVHVLTGSIAANRVVSLGVHILCAYMLYVLVASLLRQATATSQPPAESSTSNWLQAGVPATAVASWFLIHPVAVYGAGYLAQRTILFATLFSLISAWYYRRSFAENRLTDLVTAALFSSLAVMSKEHAVMLPLAVAPIGLLYERDWRQFGKRAALYLAFSAPAALLVVIGKRYLVSTSYEPYVGEVIGQIYGIPLLQKEWGPWLVSVVLQAGEFFNYLYYWLIPDVRDLSVDVRVDFVSAWHHWSLAPKAVVFLATPFLAFAALRRGGRVALAGCGLLYFWLLFMTELVTVRLQEPFVLYRSYIWAPGIAMIVVAAIAGIRWKINLAIFAVVLPALLILAQDRLSSLSSEKAVWEDAARKLTRDDIPGADRIFYNRGGEYFKSNQLDLAMQDLDRVVTLSPGVFHGHLGRGMIFLKKAQYKEALTELEVSQKMRPNSGFILYRVGLALEGLGRQPEALLAYEEAAKTGDYFAKMRLSVLKNPTK